MRHENLAFFKGDSSPLQIVLEPKICNIITLRREKYIGKKYEINGE